LNPQAFSASAKRASDNIESDSEEEEDVMSAGDLEKGYDYLLSMKIWSLTMERVQALNRHAKEKKAQLDELASKQPSDLWLEDLDALEEGERALLVMTGDT